MDMTQNIERIKNAKSSLRMAINAKGVELAEESRLESFARAVELIPTGSGTLPEVNVTADDLLDGVSAICSDGSVVVGNIPDVELSVSGRHVSIGKGYCPEDQSVDISQAQATLSGNVFSVTEGYISAQTLEVPAVTPIRTENSVTIPSGYISEPCTFDFTPQSNGSTGVKFACMTAEGALEVIDVEAAPPLPTGESSFMTPVTIELPADTSDEQWYTPLTFIAVEECSISIAWSYRIDVNADVAVEGIYYRKSETENWQMLVADSVSGNTGIYLKPGEFVQMRRFYVYAPVQSISNFFSMRFSGMVRASGNIMSLMNFTESCTPYCFQGLFYGADKLVQAPRLPSTALAERCYFGMFAGCSSLAEAPELPATELVSGCYANMFSNCILLSSLKVHFTSGWGSDTTDRWLINVSPTGVITIPDLLTAEYGEDTIPENWQVAVFPTGEQA